MQSANQPKSSIWNSFKEGDQAAFAEIYNLYFDDLYSYGIRLLEDENKIKDYIHDLFVKLCTNKKKLSDITNVKTYLIISLRGSIYNKLQRRKEYFLPREKFEEQEKFKLVFNPITTRDAHAAEAIKEKALSAALNKLTPRQKEVIYLRYFLGIGYEAIGTIMSISVKGVYKLNARGLDMLKELLVVDKSSVILLLGYTAQSLIFK